MAHMSPALVGLSHLLLSSAPNFICAPLARRPIKVKLSNGGYIEGWIDEVLNCVSSKTMKGLLLVS